MWYQNKKGEAFDLKDSKGFSFKESKTNKNVIIVGYLSEGLFYPLEKIKKSNGRFGKFFLTLHSYFIKWIIYEIKRESFYSEWSEFIIDASLVLNNKK